MAAHVSPWRSMIKKTRTHIFFLSCAHTVLCVRARAHAVINILNDFNHKKRKNCTSWPKAIKGTLISLAIMLWGILNSVISARYISRKVSGNCFVLLEQRLGNELTWFSWRFARRHPSAASPAICIHPSVLLSPCPSPCLWIYSSLAQVLISVKKKRIMGENLGNPKTLALY